MGLVVYQCTTCGRDVERIENVHGFDMIDRCVATQACSGRMLRTNRKPEHIIASKTPNVDGIDDWRQRKLFYEHTQLLVSTKWTVVHELNTHPAVQVFGFRDGKYEELSTNTYSLVFPDANTTIINLIGGFTGVAHCIARSTSNVIKEEPKIIDGVQISNNQKISCAILNLPDAGEAPNLYLQVQTPNLSIEDVVVDLTGGDENTAWDSTKIRIANKSYGIRSGSYPSFLDGSIVKMMGLSFNIVSSTGNQIEISGDHSWRFAVNAQIVVYVDGVYIKRTITAISVSNAITSLTLNSGDATHNNQLIVQISSQQAAILYSRSPHQIVDKIKDKLVYLNNFNSTVLRKELVVNPKSITTVYPSITIVR